MGYRKSIRHPIVSLLIFTAFALATASPAQAYLAPGNGQAATLVLGQTNFTNSGIATNATGLDNPAGVVVDPGSNKVFVADYHNNRVLRYPSVYALVNGAAAEAVLGQPNFSSNLPATTRNRMNSPTCLSMDETGHLWVVDSNNSRILRFDNAAGKASGASADAVLGQPNFTSSTATASQSRMDHPMGLFADAGGRLWVADFGNSRVLRFDSAVTKANGGNADGVLGQVNFTAHAPLTSQNGTSFPSGVNMDAAGRLWVADRANHRVLRFNNAAAKPNGGNADGVLGQSTFTSRVAAAGQAGMHFPQDVTVDNSTGRLFVADYLNDRILVFNAAAGLANGASASFVLGQPDFVTTTPNTGGISASSLQNPEQISFDQTSRLLFVADYFNNRVLMYGRPSLYFSANSIAADDGWTRESTETSNVGGSKDAAGLLVVGDDTTNRQYRSIVSFDTSALPDTAVLRTITLKIKRAGIVGTDPWNSFGLLVSDIRSGAFGVEALQAGDFQAGASISDVTSFTPLVSQPGWYQLVVPPGAFSAINPTGLTQFRIRFKLDDNNNHIADDDTFLAGDAPALADRPLLSIQFTMP